MSTLKLARITAALAAFMLFGTSTLSAQATESPAASEIAPAPAPSVQPAPAPVAPTPKPSPLFTRQAGETPTLAAAERAHEAENRQGRHVISMSTLTLVLVIVILVLLID